MNRTKKFLLQFVICMFTCFALLLASCGVKVEGTYKFKKMTYQQGGMSMDLEAGEEFMGMITLSEDFAVLTLNEDGSAVITVNAGTTQTTTGTWANAESGKISITFEGDTETVICDGKTIEIEVDGMKLVLAK